MDNLFIFNGDKTINLINLVELVEIHGDLYIYNINRIPSPEVKEILPSRLLGQIFFNSKTLHYTNSTILERYISKEIIHSEIIELIKSLTKSIMELQNT